MRSNFPLLTDRLRLGSAGLDVSPICIGMVGQPETVPAAFDAGINFFFVTADMHWPYYGQLRRGLSMLFERGGGIRDQVVVACVSYVAQAEFCSMPFQEVVQNVPGLDRLDVLVAGGSYDNELERRLPIYLGHRQRRFVGASGIGASFHDRSAGVRGARDGVLDVCFVRYNAAHPGAREDLFPHVADRRALLYNFKTMSGYVAAPRLSALGLGDDDWHPVATDHYRFALSAPELDGILCSPQTPAEVEALARALEQGPLDEEEQRYLMDLAALDRGEVELDR